MTSFIAIISVILVAGWVQLLLVAIRNDGLFRAGASLAGHRTPPRSHVPDGFEPRGRF